MGIETYILIAVCYGLGCRLSYKLGANRGMDAAIRNIAKDLAEMTGTNPHAVVKSIMDHRKQKALKS